MGDLIRNNYRGATITLAITGLPMTITGEVVTVENSVVTLRVKDGRIVNIASDLIGFFF